MKEWLSSIGKWFLAKSLAVKSLIVVLCAAVVVTVGGGSRLYVPETGRAGGGCE